MSKTLQQIFTANPQSVNLGTDLMYFVQSPYTPGTDTGMTFTDFSAQFGSPYTASALTEINDTNVTLTLGGTPATSLLKAVSITAGWTGQLSVSRGGTGLSAVTSHFLMVGNGTSPLTLLGPSATSGIPLISQGVAADPAYGTAVVSGGGTGNTTFTAFSVICAGTTATGPFQNVVGLGTAGEQLTSNGPGLLPTWQASGTVSPLTTKGDLYTFTTVNARLPVGTINGQILQVNSGTATGLAWSTATYPATALSVARILRSDGTNYVDSTSTFADTYAASGFLYANGANNVAGLATAINGVPVTDNTGVPSILAGPAATGHILTSNAAAAPSWSTSTFPSVGGTAGNVLISDGTNYIASTSLWPNTVGAAGKIVRSNGTTNAYSTATYPDTAGTSGNILTSDGTNWSSSAPAAASTVTITNDTTTNASMFPTWVTANTGSLPLKVSSTKFSFNPSTAALTLTGSITGLTGKIDAPTAIASSTGLNVLSFSYAASAVNNLQVTNAVTGSTPSLSAVGTDANISIFIAPKSGNVNISDSLSAVAPILKIFNAAGTHGTGLQVATAQSTDVTFTLPATDGSANFVMKTNGSGVLSLTNGSQIAGTATNDNASAGNIGEYISSAIASASAVSLTTATAKTITSISLTAGDWDVWGNIIFAEATGTVATTIISAISTTNNALPTITGGTDAIQLNDASQAASSLIGQSTGTLRVSLSGTTTYYLIAQASFTVSTMTAYGFIGARRSR